jgi:hypothetical protein
MGFYGKLDFQNGEAWMIRLSNTFFALKMSRK